MPNIKYQILQADKAGMPALPGLVFEDPQEASHKAKKLSREMGEKLVVKLIIDPKWKEREKRRIDDGTYRDMPWLPYPWWVSTMAYAIWKDQYPHPSLERPGFLAYTANEEDGTKDKQSIVRPGAYLKKYFSQVLNYYGYDESPMIDVFMAAYGPTDVKFATTEQEIITLYEHGVHTCMQGRHWPFAGKNPAHIYAAGDLQVAYLGSLENAKARTVVWPEKKLFSRVYGDIARLTRGLEKLGYKWGAPIGAKIKRIEIRKVKFDPNRGPPTACFIVPYIDKKNQPGGGHLSVIDKGDHLLICEEGVPGSHHCGLPDGYSGQYVPREDEFPTFTCDNCKTAGHRELSSVYTEENPEDCDEASWCKKCTARYAFHCQWSGSWFAKDKVKPTQVDGHYWSPYYVEMYAIECEMSGRLTHKDNAIQVWIDGKPKRVSSIWLDDNGGGFKSGITNRYYLRKERVNVLGPFGGIHAAKPELKYHTFQCDGCRNTWQIDHRIQENDKLFCPTCGPVQGPDPGFAPIPKGVKAQQYKNPFLEINQFPAPPLNQIFNVRNR